MSDLFSAFLYNRSFIIGVEATGLLFFGALTIDSLLRPDKRVYLPSLLLIDVGFVSALVRTLFFFDLSPHPARPGGIWRLATAGILVWGMVRFERTRRLARHQHKG